MTTTGELNAIIEELELVDIGDAASYLGEEAALDGQLPDADQSTLLSIDGSGNLATVRV